MADDQQPGQQSGCGSGSLPSLVPTGLQGSEASALQFKIKSSICKSVQSKVDSILQDVEKFTDIEKLYLYLRLPSGPSCGSDKSEQSCVSSSRTQQMHAFGWIRNHLEEHPETSLPKQEVYDEYKSYCDNLGYHALSAADFGKIMKNVFPNMKARRLGMRGKSKYCYSGLRKKAFIHMPSLPNLDVHKTGDGCEGFESVGQGYSGEDEVRVAACGLVCEWAQKVLSRHFDSVEDLARFLLNSHYIGTKSVAALTVMTGSPSGAKLQSSAFVPTMDAHSFQPQMKTLASPSIDAKQQLQRKIQKKQQEQKLHSPLPAEAQARRADRGGTPGASAGVPCGSPALLSPQPTIGIVVAAVPSPITVQRSRQLMSPSPVPIATAESKVLPVNFQVVTQAMQPMKQCPKTPQNVPVSPVGDRSARHRYAQILPKPVTTNPITLHSPSALLITNSPIKPVIPTAQVGSVNVVKMTAISLGASNGSNTTVATLATNSKARPASAGVVSISDDPPPVTRVRSGSIAAVPSAMVRSGRTTSTTPVSDIKLVSVGVSGQVQGETISQEAGGNIQKLDVTPKPRAASVPTPLAKVSAGLEMQQGTKCNGKMLPRQCKPASGSNNNAKESTLFQGVPNLTTSSALTTSSRPFVTSPRDVELASRSPRKRQGLCSDSSLTPVKKVFVTQLSSGATESFKSVIGASVKNAARSNAPMQPESAPASAAGKATVKFNSCAPTHILALSDSPVVSSCFQTVSRQQGSSQAQYEGSTSDMTTAATGNSALTATHQDSLIGNGSFQTFVRKKWEGSSPSMDSKPIVTQAVSASRQTVQQLHSNKHSQAMQVSSDQSDPSVSCELKGVFWNNGQQDSTQQQAYSQQGSIENDHSGQSTSPVMKPLSAMSQPSGPGQLVQMTADMVDYVSSQPHVGFFPFNDDDMTQDSIVEELVQMEEQMKMNSSMPDFGDCVDMALQGEQTALQNNMMVSQLPSTSYYSSVHSSSTPIHTPTPTPTPTTEMTGGGQVLTCDSPCLRLVPTTPVDGALGSSCQTPIGTPHSSCSSSVPPSPVECRNPFAFTPINSSITSYHDGSIVSSSPVKPMQRPMATHPDKAKLEWMNNNYNNINSNSSNGISILPSYLDLVDDQFRKPHAFAIPGQTYQSQIRHHDPHVSRLTPISPVQQQVASMSSKQEGFAVPAPLDNKTSTSTASGCGTFRCRSVSPAVRQRNLSGNPNPKIPRSAVSPFSSAVTPEVLNIFASSQANASTSSIAQRSQSVPLNVMMQTEVLPMQVAGQSSNAKKIANVLLSKMDGDGDSSVRGLGINNVPSGYTARMNLTQILETTARPSFPSNANHQALISPGSVAYKFQKPAYLIKNARGEQISFSAREGQAQQTSGERQQQVSEEERQQNRALLVPPQQNLQEHQHQQPLHFSSTVKDLLEENGLNNSSQLSGQTSELNTGTSEFSGDMRLTSELSSSMNDLNTLDTNLLFDPSRQLGQYEESTLEELKNDPLFQQICSETVNSAGFDWLESKDQATVEMLG
ncbi:DNA-binding protein RFX7 isoform X1 [Electrophorus electricus]|uniref:DNA-binding protein RFX7 isoform X1 n=2 Tax=Electrophorus electricus TaxID=8005 RepID=UPI0015D03FA6|nr:DNA-binding protein RFX7 isoform X1 [Electrophorus electricus]